MTPAAPERSSDIGLIPYPQRTDKTTTGHLAGKELNMYKVWRVLRDEHGNIVHKTPIGCSRTERGARALIAGQWGECIIEKLR